MEIAIFAKKRTTREGKPFVSFISTLTRKDGTQVSASVKFRESAGMPDAKACPMNIKFAKSAANLSTKSFVRADTGEVATAYTLWVSAWEPGAPYVDNSLDDFE